MTLDEKRWVVAALSFMFLGALLIVAWVEGGRQRVQPEAAPVVAGESARCYDCHAEQTPVIATQWAGSEHARLGVGCGFADVFRPGASFGQPRIAAA